MSVLVTGGAGYVGSATARLLRRLGREVIVLDTLEHGHPAAVGDARLVVGTIADVPLVRSLLRDHRVDSVLHFAALKSVEESVADPVRYYETNVAGSIALLRAMELEGVRHLVFSSTCAVYGTPARLPVDETNPTRPENAYGETKLATERLIDWTVRTGRLTAVALRYFNAAGASADGRHGEDWTGAQNLVPVTLSVAFGRTPRLTVFGTDYPTDDGTAIRDYIHVDDLAEAHIRALDHLRDGGSSTTLNLGTGTGASVRDIVELARRETGRPIPTVDAGRRPGDPAAIWADTSLARRTLGWSARRDLAEIIRSAWAWHVARPDGYTTDAAGRDQAALPA